MNRAVPVRIERVRRTRGTFGLDERRRPDPARIEAEIRAFLDARLPEVWALPALVDPAAGPYGRTVVLLLPRGHAAVLRIEPDPAAPHPSVAGLLARCRARAIPAALVGSLAEARAALRRFGVEPPPSSSLLPFPRSLRRCRAK